MYTRTSTANPLGFRPWQYGLSYYLQNSFPLPTTGLGCDGCAKRPRAGLAYAFPNFAVAGPGKSAGPRFIPRGAPYPNIYRPLELAIPRMAGLGDTAATVTVPVGGQTVTVSTAPTAGLPASISDWLDAQWITGVPNKYLAIGGLALWLLGRR